jgi:GntR family transcriptional regulator
VSATAHDLRAAEALLTDLPPLQSGSPLPLYAQLAERLAGAIRPRRAALAGALLPSELHLMQHFGVSRPTVRQAMAQLAHGGLITRGRGRGTFVAPERLNHDVSLAFEDEMRAARKTVRFEVLKRETLAPTAAVQTALGIRPTEAVERIERLRFLDNEPFAHEQRTLPASLAAAMTEPMLETLAVISLMAAAGQRPARISNTVRCMAGEARVTGLLGLRPRTPLLQTEHVYYGQSGQPLLHGVVRFRWDRVEFTMESAIDAAPRLAP